MSSNEQNSGPFKLVAIVPLKDCHSRFRKNLSNGEVYQFYQDYEIKCIDENEIESFKRKKSVPNIDLYKLDNGVQLNISAIVGKNGSGKSSILELLYYAIYKISVQMNFRRSTVQIMNDKLNDLSLAETTHNHYLNEELSEEFLLKYLRIHDYKNIEAFYLDLAENLKSELPDHFRYQEKKDIVKLFSNGLELRKIKLKSELDEEQIFQNLLTDSLNVAILFEKGGDLFDLKMDGSDITLKNWSDNSFPCRRDFYRFEFKELFYSVSINYSHHSLNKGIQGRWLDELFHKNDGYKTPIVINPMRDDGKIDINREEAFARSRLLSNIVSARIKGFSDRQVLLNEEQDILAVHFSLNKNTERKLKINPERIEDWSWYDEGSNLEVVVARDFLQKLVGAEYETIKKLPYAKLLVDYFIRKFDKIRYTYDIYREIPKPSIAAEHPEYVDRIYNRFIEDESHVTFKLKQVINFFKSCLIDENRKAWSISENHVFTIDELIKITAISKSDTYRSIIEKLPPVIFDIEFFFTSKSSDDQKEMAALKSDTEVRREAPKFGKLSSGEKQLMHSVQTVIYHLNNLDSVVDGGSRRPSYSSVNVIFDEIELYFHPDLQRKFIDYLVASINRVQLKPGKGVNVIFATHSPFILSDIPSANILRLINGKPEPKDNQTFGANIHRLLADDFFMSDGYIGAFAKKKIQLVINTLKKEDLPEDQKLGTYEMWAIIQLIGEPFLKRKLETMFLSKDENSDFLQTELEKAKAEVKRLESLNKKG